MTQNQSSLATRLAFEIQLKDTETLNLQIKAILHGPQRHSSVLQFAVVPRSGPNYAPNTEKYCNSGFLLLMHPLIIEKV